MGKTIALVTCGFFPDLYPEDQVLLALLQSAGIEPQAIRWDDPSASWSQFAAVVLRSPWDYVERFEEFAGWLADREADGTKLWNSPAVISWNLNKRYLMELEASGVNVVPTRWLDHGSTASLKAVLEEQGWDRAVIKPGISAGARRTYVVTPASASEHQTELESMLSGGDVMVQPFIERFVFEGELSLLFFGGEFSHAVLKSPAAGDFRVQEMHGGRTVPADVGDAIIEQARATLAYPPEEVLYARVDGVREPEGFMLIELEVFEPVLYLAHKPEAAAMFVREIVKRVG